MIMIINITITIIIIIIMIYDQMMRTWCPCEDKLSYQHDQTAETSSGGCSWKIIIFMIW